MRYFIDLKVLSILFGTQDDVRLTELLKQIGQDVTAISAECLKEIYRANGITDEELKIITANPNIVPDKVKVILEKGEVFQKIENDVQAYYKVLYDIKMPALSSEQQKELVDYLNEENNMDMISRNTQMAYWNTVLQTKIAEQSQPQAIQLNLGGIRTAPTISSQEVGAN
jgi:hypothetical protein